MSKFTRNAVSLGLLSVLIIGLTFLLTGCGFINQDPTAKISTTPEISNGVAVGTTINFYGNNSEDEDGEIEDYDWDFKFNKTEDATSTAENPTYTYDTAGTYTVNLTVTDDDGATDSASATVEVTDSGASAEFTISTYPAEVGEDVKFDPSGSTGDNIDTYNWDFDDEPSTTKDSDQVVSHSYSSAGSYEVTLTLKDSSDNFLASEGTTLVVQTSSSTT